MNKCKYDELADPDSVKDHPFNPNCHPVDQIDRLARYILSTGWRLPVIVSRQSGYIVAGHGRKQAAKKIGCEMPIVYQDFDDEKEERAFLLADNRIAELAEMDKDKLNLNIGFLSDEGFDMSSIGFDCSFDLSFMDGETDDDDQDLAINRDTKEDMTTITVYVRKTNRKELFAHLEQFQVDHEPGVMIWQKK